MMYLRSRLWRGESLTDKDRQLWDYVYAKVPTWALFQRIQISEEDRQWQEFGQQLADKFDACWEAFPEEFEVCQEGTDEDDK
jgi:hypothetical protein